MTKCVYCSKSATTIDALGLDACTEHASEADKYYQQRTGRHPDEDPFLYCDKHCDMWQPDCERCEACSQHHYGMPVKDFLDSPLSKQLEIVSLDDTEDFIAFLEALRKPDTELSCSEHLERHGKPCGGINGGCNQCPPPRAIAD